MDCSTEIARPKTKKLSPIRKKSYKVKTNLYAGVPQGSPQKMFQKTYLFPTPDPSGLDIRRVEVSVTIKACS